MEEMNENRTGMRGAFMRRFGGPCRNAQARFPVGIKMRSGKPDASRSMLGTEDPQPRHVLTTSLRGMQLGRSPQLGAK